MALYLVQHGKSLPEEVDPGRGLSHEGIDDVKRIAGVAQGYGVKVSKILHSGKNRAAQTAMIFAEMLIPPGGVAQQPGLGPLDDISGLVSELDPGADIMLVGHLPFMERLVCRLTTGADGGQTIFKFQNGGVVCLEGQEHGLYHIKWALMPQIG